MARCSRQLVFFSIALAAANAQAAVGDSVAHLIARYGEPENGFALLLGMGQWNTPQGEVLAMLEDQKAVLMLYEGVDENTKNALLKQSLPMGQKWVNGKDFKAFMQTHMKSDPDRNEIDQMQFWQTADGKVWAGYKPMDKSLMVSTPESVNRLARLFESIPSGPAISP